MVAKYVVLPFFFAVAIAGCMEEKPQPEEKAKEQTNEKTKEQIKVPRTTAELLVGNWEWIKTPDSPTSGIVKERVVFTADGLFSFHIDDITQTKRYQNSFGTYRFEGRTLQLSYPAQGGEPAQTADMPIELITETELILVSPPEDSGRRFRSKYKRLDTM